MRIITIASVLLLAVSVGATGMKTGYRPLDSSNVEMQSYMRAIEALGPCGKGPGETCGRRQLFKDAGPALAEYLIAQYELSVAEEYLGSPTLLRYIAYTETEVGFSYIRRLAFEKNHRALEALAFTNDVRAVDTAMALFPELDAKGRVVAVTVVQRNGAERQDVPGWLRSVNRGDDTAEVRQRAESALWALGIKR